MEASLYETEWLNMSTNTIKILKFMGLRMQNHMAISVQPIVKALSLEFLGVVREIHNFLRATGIRFQINSHESVKSDAEWFSRVYSGVYM